MSEGLIYKQIPAVMAKSPATAKDRKNTQQRFSYRGIEDL